MPADVGACAGVGCGAVGGFLLVEFKNLVVKPVMVPVNHFIWSMVESRPWMLQSLAASRLYHGFPATFPPLALQEVKNLPAFEKFEGEHNLACKWQCSPADLFVGGHIQTFIDGDDNQPPACRLQSCVKNPENRYRDLYREKIVRLPASPMHRTTFGSARRQYLKLPDDAKKMQWLYPASEETRSGRIRFATFDEDDDNQLAVFQLLNVGGFALFPDVQGTWSLEQSYFLGDADLKSSRPVPVLKNPNKPKGGWASFKDAIDALIHNEPGTDIAVYGICVVSEDLCQTRWLVWRSDMEGKANGMIETAILPKDSKVEYQSAHDGGWVPGKVQSFENGRYKLDSYPADVEQSKVRQRAPEELTANMQKFCDARRPDQTIMEILSHFPTCCTQLREAVEDYLGADVCDQQWSTNQSRYLGFGEQPKPPLDFLRKQNVHVFERGQASSIQSVVANLNSREISVDSGLCVAFSENKQTYYLLWRADMLEKAIELLRAEDVQNEGCQMIPRALSQATALSTPTRKASKMFDAKPVQSIGSQVEALRNRKWCSATIAAWHHGSRMYEVIFSDGQSSDWLAESHIRRTTQAYQNGAQVEALYEKFANHDQSCRERKYCSAMIKAWDSNTRKYQVKWSDDSDHTSVTYKVHERNVRLGPRVYTVIARKGDSQDLLRFRPPRKMPPQMKDILKAKGRFQRVTAKPLLQAGAQMFCWLVPNEQFEGWETFEGCDDVEPPYLPHGGFAYIMKDSTCVRIIDSLKRGLDKFMCTSCFPKRECRLSVQDCYFAVAPLDTFESVRGEQQNQKLHSSTRRNGAVIYSEAPRRPSITVANEEGVPGDEDEGNQVH